MIVAESGASNDYAHLHLEIRPYNHAATFYNPLYFFDKQANYANNYAKPEWRIIGYTSKDSSGFHDYWKVGDQLPQIWYR